MQQEKCEICGLGLRRAAVSFGMRGVVPALAFAAADALAGSLRAEPLVVGIVPLRPELFVAALAVARTVFVLEVHGALLPAPRYRQGGGSAKE